jgi:hypothetical protein
MKGGYTMEETIQTTSQTSDAAVKKHRRMPRIKITELYRRLGKVIALNTHNETKLSISKQWLELLALADKNEEVAVPAEAENETTDETEEVTEFD